MNDIITLSTTVTTTNGTAYASGDNVGGLIKFKGADIFFDRVGYIQSAVITDLGKQNVEADLVIFREKPNLTTFTNDAAMDIDDGDITKIIGIITFDTWKAFNDNSASTVAQLAVPINIEDSQIYATLVTRGAPTYTSTSDISVRINLFR